VGTLSLVSAVLTGSQILAFMGLGLAFWGALFFFIMPTKYVQGRLLGGAAISSYQTIDRIINDLKFKGHGYYIPPYPKNAYLPDHLKGLKEMIVFVPAENDVQTPPIEETAKGKFLLNNSKGILIAPPGGGLLGEIEKDLKIDFNNMELNNLCEVLPRFILNNLSLAKDMEMNLEENQVNIKILDSIYKDLYSNEANLKSVCILGCPIISAAACALAKATGKSVTVQELQVLPNDQIEAKCNIQR
jgi:hypothetical protein